MTTNVFFTGCTHFNHANIIALAKRPFADVDAMNEAMCENWNRVVRRYDKVFHLGDFSWRGPRTEGRSQWITRLNGEITFIQGNHDPKGWGPDTHTLAHNGRKIVLFHYPIGEWDGWWHGALHLHCHTHSSQFVSAVRRFNVGVDANGFTPVHLDDILAHENARFVRAELEK